MLYHTLFLSLLFSILQYIFTYYRKPNTVILLIHFIEFRTAPPIKSDQTLFSYYQIWPLCTIFFIFVYCIFSKQLYQCELSAHCNNPSWILSHNIYYFCFRCQDIQYTNSKSALTIRNTNKSQKISVHISYNTFIILRNCYLWC